MLLESDRLITNLYIEYWNEKKMQSMKSSMSKIKVLDFTRLY